MGKAWTRAALVAVIGLVALACNGNSSVPTTAGQTSGPQRGGTLRIVMNSDVTHTMDPQIEYYQLPFA